MINWLLDVVANAYYWFWHWLLELPEPFTSIFCRIEQHTPWLLWGVVMYIIWVADRSWWGLYASILATWFIHHMSEYRAEHPEDKPYFLGWACRRLNAKSQASAGTST